MERFVPIDAKAVPLRQADIDTDQIIPARFLQKPREAGLSDYLFRDLRFDDLGIARTDFILNRPEYAGARVLVAGRNFGCGSSRETAVWALKDYGFRVVIAPSFGDIFRNNSFANGLLPIVLAKDVVEDLQQTLELHPGAHLQVELERSEVVAPGGRILGFEIDAFRKQCLLQGLDELGLTLSLEPHIAAFERRTAQDRPWL
jgi:3-isopropylmalate/(R)-2-methylmalate dehydratase small subunit